ncbi:CCA tRNA nucleotidyltransferase [Thalassospira sp. MA62]|nr:CCA tRNA nucleotidyltransferase [Thalassospira sp. MA62]
MSALEITGNLRPYGVMVADDTVRLFKVIEDAGGTARFVGGIVRDALLNRDLIDVDIACDLAPETTLKVLEDAGIRVIPTGLKHGTVTAITDFSAYEITTLRVDVKADGRHAEVAFTDSWLADAKRRDFTFNAIYCDLDGTVYDPFDGETDLRNGKVRFIGVAENRIAEDYLRILRFFRFQAWFGHPPVDPIGAEACRKNADGLHGISGERIRDELFKLLRARSPAATVNDMIGFRVLPTILPELDQVASLRMMQWLDSTALADPAITPDPLRRLAALFSSALPEGDLAPTAERLAQKIRLSNAQTERFVAMIENAPLIDPGLDDDTIRRDLYRMGADCFRDAVLLGWSMRGAVPPRCSPDENSGWKRLLDIATHWHPVALPLQGRDILQAGLAPAGPQIGIMLKQAEEYWIDRGFVPDRDALIAYLAGQNSVGSQETE